MLIFSIVNSGSVADVCLFLGDGDFFGHDLCTGQHILPQACIVGSTYAVV